jgi:peptide deformylase
MLCNPEIVKVSRETEIGQEGCLSVAGYVGMVERALAVIVRGQDVKGRKVRVKADDFLARAFQHEIDHLNGVLYVDLAEQDSVMTLEDYNQMIQEQAEAEAEAEAEQVSEKDAQVTEPASTPV